MARLQQLTAQQRLYVQGHRHHTRLITGTRRIVRRCDSRNRTRTKAPCLANKTSIRATKDNSSREREASGRPLSNNPVNDFERQLVAAETAEGAIIMVSVEPQVLLATIVINYTI